MPENEDAIFIYMIVHDQLIAGFDSQILNHAAVHSAMELYNIQDRKSCFEKVLMLARHFRNRNG